MVRYLVNVFKFMRKHPLDGGDFSTWVRNCFYLNWQIPVKWNFDLYWAYKQMRYALEARA